MSTFWSGTNTKKVGDKGCANQWMRHESLAVGGAGALIKNKRSTKHQTDAENGMEDVETNSEHLFKELDESKQPIIPKSIHK